ncbi:hypothetical protein D3C76_1578870 [compost metagenome]
MASAQRNQFQCVNHVVIGNSHNTASNFFARQIHTHAQFAQRTFYGSHVGVHCPAAEVILVDSAKSQVRVSCGYVIAAIAVSSRARKSAC